MSNCTKVYLVPTDQIGKSVRKVKCKSCNYIWYEYPSNEPSYTRVQAKKKVTF